ncbi:hypothetical protein [Pseudomonas taetrolens]|uniref:hypothetical protein n=1 Tax=Pseudomonas taetrolens TaxID=47884 RepID=UPI003F94DF06
MSDPTSTLIRVPTVSAVRAQFASRPTLENATRQALASAIAEKYPTLVIDVSRVRLATPDSDGTCVRVSTGLSTCPAKPVTGWLLPTAVWTCRSLKH